MATKARAPLAMTATLGRSDAPIEVQPMRGSGVELADGVVHDPLSARGGSTGDRRAGSQPRHGVPDGLVAVDAKLRLAPVGAEPDPSLRALREPS